MTVGLGRESWENTWKRAAWVGCIGRGQNFWRQKYNDEVTFVEALGMRLDFGGGWVGSGNVRGGGWCWRAGSFGGRAERIFFGKVMFGALFGRRSCVRKKVLGWYRKGCDCRNWCS